MFKFELPEIVSEDTKRMNGGGRPTLFALALNGTSGTTLISRKPGWFEINKE